MNRRKNKYALIAALLLCCHAPASLAERADRDKPIQMEADSVTVDDPRQTSIFEGHVKMSQGTLLIEADKIEVSQDSKGNSRAVASGKPAHLRQKKDATNEFVEGYGERIEYDNQAETANLYGQARISRANDEVRGEHIIYNTRTGIFQVFGSNAQTSVKQPGNEQPGRVTIVIQPRPSSNSPAASSVPAGSAVPPNSPAATKPATSSPH